MALEVRIERSTSAATILLAGKLTLGPQLRQFSRQMESIFNSGHPNAIFIDCGALLEVDSAGLGELMILYTTAGRHDCRLGLIEVPGKVQRLLEITKLSAILRCFADRAAADGWLKE